MSSNDYIRNIRGRSGRWKFYLMIALAGCFALGAAAHADAAGPKAYVGNFKDNSVSVVDTAAGSVVATVPVSAGPHGMAITSNGATVYVSGDGASSVDVIDTASDKVVKTIDVG